MNVDDSPAGTPVGTPDRRQETPDGTPVTPDRRQQTPAEQATVRPLTGATGAPGAAGLDTIASGKSIGKQSSEQSGKQSSEQSGKQSSEPNIKRDYSELYKNYMYELNLKNDGFHKTYKIFNELNYREIAKQAAETVADSSTQPQMASQSFADSQAATQQDSFSFNSTDDEEIIAKIIQQRFNPYNKSSIIEKENYIIQN